MPQIIVIADQPAGDGEAAVMFRERVTVSDFESGHFTTQFVERLGWAVGDADEYAQRAVGDGGELERRAPGSDRRRFQRSASVVTTAS